MPHLSPYISFAGKAKEAMTFYQECFGGQLELNTIAGSPMEEHCPPEMKDNIFHSSLTTETLSIMATDLVGPHGLVAGNNLSLALMCATEDEINSLFAKLSGGGEVATPLAKQFWGAIFGQLTDKFGITWMLNCYIKE